MMTLRQGISIIMGANIGTTITAQIIAFQISDYIYIIIFIGFIFSLLYKSEQKKNIWQTVFAFGLLFLGIDTMGNVMSPLAESPVFVHMIERVARYSCSRRCCGNDHDTGGTEQQCDYCGYCRISLLRRTGWRDEVFWG